MSQDLWTAVDRYISDTLIPPDPVLEAALASSQEAALPSINVSPAQGKLLMLMAQMKGASKILEIGTLGAYSTIWLARALPSDGRLISLELDPKHAAVAKANIARAQLQNKVQIRVGPALETLPVLLREGLSPFDFVFIDADKPNNPNYFKWALKLSSPGSVIVIDNTIRAGTVIEDNSTDVNVQGVRQLNELLASEPQANATSIQTVGCKGYDGFTIVRLK